MIELLKGKSVSDKIKENIIEMLSGGTIVPRLAVVRVGEKPEDIAYEKSATKKLTGMGIEVISCALPSDISPEKFKSEFSSINGDADIDGILIMRPLPGHLKEAEQWMVNTIDPEKDVDGVSPVNLAEIMRGDTSAFAPCTAQAVTEILKGHGISLQGKNITIIGRSMVVGKPLAMLLLTENATVTICHTKTENLSKMCRTADIIVAATGHGKLVGSDFVREGQILADVGIDVDSEGNLIGDIDLAEIEAEGISVMATPVPGGVGTVTTAVLAEHICRAKIRKNRQF